MMKRRIEGMLKTALGRINRLNWARRAGGLDFSVHEHPSTGAIQIRFFAAEKMGASAFKEKQLKKRLAAAAAEHALDLNEASFSSSGELSLWAAHVKREKVKQLMKKRAGRREYKKPHTWMWKVTLPAK